jgi:hypothetical protein
MSIDVRGRVFRASLWFLAAAAGASAPLACSSSSSGGSGTDGGGSGSGSSSGGGSGSSSGGVTAGECSKNYSQSVCCNQASQGKCTVFAVTPGIDTESALQQECTGNANGTVATSCPSTGFAGCCNVNPGYVGQITEVCYYSPTTEANAGCPDGGWITTP